MVLFGPRSFLLVKVCFVLFIGSYPAVEASRTLRRQDQRTREQDRTSREQNNFPEHRGTPGERILRSVPTNTRGRTTVPPELSQTIPSWA